MDLRDRYEMLLKKNKAFAGAFRKGWFAAKAGKPKSENPYRDKRTKKNSVTYSRAFSHYWNEGFARFLGIIDGNVVSEHQVESGRATARRVRGNRN